MTARQPGNSSGFSLVEILVAMTLGVVLLGGAVAIFASSKDSYRLQENIAGMQENGRYAIQALRRGVEMAGYPRIRDVTPFIVADASGGLVDANGDTLTGIGATANNDGNNGSDTVTIQYRSRGTTADRDCLGVGITNGRMIINQYFIDNNELRCRGIGSAAAQALAENVQNLQALYGVDDDGDGTANRYVRADQVGEGGVPGWDSVVSLRLALLVASGSTIGTSEETGELALLDATVTPPADGRLYRVFTTTIPLRNRIP